MPEPLKWFFSLLDGMSGPANNMAKSVTLANTALKNAKPAGSDAEIATLKVAKAQLQAAVATHKLAGEVADLTKQFKPVSIEMGNMMHSFAGFRQEADGRWIFNVAEGFTAVLDVVGNLTGKLVDLTKQAVEVGAAGEKSGRAFKLNLGQAGGAELLTYLDRVEAKSRGLYTQAQLRDLAAPLAQHGIGLPDIKNFLPAALSVQQRGGSASGALGALGGIRTNRSVDAGTLEALGLGSLKDKQNIAAQLSTALHFGGGSAYAKKDPEALLGALGERLKWHPEQVQTTIAVVLAALAKREGSALGNEAAGAQVSGDATLQRLQNLPTLISERLSQNGQLSGLMDSLNKFTDVLTGPQGKGFIDGLALIIDKFANIIVKVSGWIGDDSAGDKIRKSGGIAFENDAGQVTDQISQRQKVDLALRAFRATPGNGASDFGGIPSDKVEQFALLQYHRDNKAKASAGRGTVLENDPNELLSKGKFAPAAFDIGRDLGGNIADGLALGMVKSQAPQLAIRFMLQNGVILPAQETLAIKSPSKVFQRLGGYTAEGFALGIEGGQSRIDRAMDSAFAVDDIASASRFNTGGKGGLGGANVAFNFGGVTVNGAGKNADEIADEVLAKLQEKAPGALLLSALEQFAVEAG